MKLVDEKGKLFGLVNIIDLSVILILIAGALFIYLGYRSVHEHQHGYAEEIYYITVLCESLPLPVADAIKVGDVGKVGSAEVVAVKRVDVRVLISPGTALKVHEGSEELLDYVVVPKLLITFKGICQVKHNEIYLNGIARKVGQPFGFSTLTYDITGIMVDISKELKQ